MRLDKAKQREWCSLKSSLGHESLASYVFTLGMSGPAKKLIAALRTIHAYEHLGMKWSSE